MQREFFGSLFCHCMLVHGQKFAYSATVHLLQALVAQLTKLYGKVTLC